MGVNVKALAVNRARIALLCLAAVVVALSSGAVQTSAQSSPDVALPRPGAEPAAAARADDGRGPERLIDPDTLPKCAYAPEWRGFPTEKAADAAPDDVPVCRADPAYIVENDRKDVPLPHPVGSTGCGGTGEPSCYHHFGSSVGDGYYGGDATIKVTNPDVSHSGDTSEFLVSRVMAVDYGASGGPDWHEIGWAETNFLGDGNTRIVYTCDTQYSCWRKYTAYTLTTGSFYRFKVEQCLSNGGPGICSFIYWNNSWQYLNESWDINQPMGIEFFTEVHSGENTPHPHVSADLSDAIRWRDLKMCCNSSGAWFTPGSSHTGWGGSDPYKTCMVTRNSVYKVYRKDATVPQTECVETRL